MKNRWKAKCQQSGHESLNQEALQSEVSHLRVVSKYHIDKWMDETVMMWRGHPYYALENICCQPGKAWSKTYAGGSGLKQVIPLALMREEAATWGA